MKWQEISQLHETGMSITRSHLKMLTEMHWNPGFCLVISHPGGQGESICERQMELNGIMVKYQQYYLSDWERKTTEMIWPVLRTAFSRSGCE